MSTAIKICKVISFTYLFFFDMIYTANAYISLFFMKALIFPGQGSQHIGMGKDIFDSSKTARKIFKLADDLLGYRLSELIFNGPLNDLSQTTHTQPALLTVSFAMLTAFLEENKTSVNEYFDCIAGHSLGEYSAFVAAGVFTFEEALTLVKLRGESMQNAMPNGDGAMAAILNLDMGILTSCLPDDESCVIANDNAPGQIIISGQKDAVLKTMNIAKEKGAKRCLILPVSGAFHSPFMEPAKIIMKKEFEKVTFKKPSLPLITNINATATNCIEGLKQALENQICGQVRWRESILYMAKMGVQDFYEMGPGNVLAGLNKRIL